MGLRKARHVEEMHTWVGVLLECDRKRREFEIERTVKASA